MKATRISDDPTKIVVVWTLIDDLINKLKLEILEDEEGSWSVVSGASDMTISTTEFKVENLTAEAKYKFRLDMRRPGENNPTYVESNEGRSRVKGFFYSFWISNPIISLQIRRTVLDTFPAVLMRKI